MVNYTESSLLEGQQKHKKTWKFPFFRFFLHVNIDKIKYYIYVLLILF